VAVAVPVRVVPVVVGFLSRRLLVLYFGASRHY
jgi:hypothetical protein